MFFFFNDTATTEIYTLSLHDALPICGADRARGRRRPRRTAARERIRPRVLVAAERRGQALGLDGASDRGAGRSEEHTSELQSRQYLVCRLLLEKKKNQQTDTSILTSS